MLGRKRAGCSPVWMTGTRVPLLSMVKLISPWLSSWTERSTTRPSMRKRRVPSWARDATASSAVLKYTVALPSPSTTRNTRAPTTSAPATHSRRVRALSRARTRGAGPTAPGPLRSPDSSASAPASVPASMVKASAPPLLGACRAPAAGPAGRPNRRRRPGSTARRGSRRPRTRSRHHLEKLVGLGPPLGQGCLEAAVLEPGGQVLHPVAVHDQPGVDQGEGDEPQQHGLELDAVDQGLAPQEGGPLVQRPPPVHRVVDDGNVDRGHQAADGRARRPASGLARHPAQGEVPEEEGEQQRRGREAGVPGPPHAPGRAPPDRARDQGQGCEHDTDLGRHAREEIPPPPAPAPTDVQETGQHGHAEGDLAHGGDGGVDVDQADQLSLHHVGRRRPQSEHHGARQRHQGAEAQHPGQCRRRALHASSRRAPKATTPKATYTTAKMTNRRSQGPAPSPAPPVPRATSQARVAERSTGAATGRRRRGSSVSRTLSPADNTP